MIDLKEASRDELIRLIVRQHEEIGVLARTVEQMQEANATLAAQVTQLTARVTALLVALDAATGGDDAGTRGGWNAEGDARTQGEYACPASVHTAQAAHASVCAAAHGANGAGDPCP